jgi:hypothetical protein
MIVGSGNYLYVSGKHGSANSRSRRSKVWVVRHHGNVRCSTGSVDVGLVHFPKSCVGMRVRVRVEFVDLPNKVLDKDRVLVEPVSFEVKHY